MGIYTVDSQHIPELPGAGRLGRHVLYDSRRAAYPYQAPAEVTITAKTWPRHAPIFDQGAVGSCTGNAMTGAAGTTPLFEVLPAGHPPLDEDEALRIYSEAENIDGDGPYPPNDNGSSGQSVCKAAQRDGLISGYTWGNTTDAVLAALMAGPVCLGINWYSSFDDPDAAGIVALPATAQIRGGHEILAREVDVDRQLVGCDNSWGASWGLDGRFFLPYAVLTRLLSENGDCAVPLPLTVPAPAPLPVPPVPVPPVPVIQADAADRALAAAIPAGWPASHNRRHDPSQRVAAALTTWERTKGLLS